MMEPIVWVFIASLVVWGGIFFYLIAMELRLARLERATSPEQRRSERR